MKNVYKELAEELGKYTHDPYGFVLFAFPWGSGSLERFQSPDTWQSEQLKAIGKKLQEGADLGCVIKEATAAATGVGKALPLSTIVDTPAGKKRWGDIKKGDYLLGTNGMPTRVLQVDYQGVRPIYKVTFDDGSTALVDKDHLWTVRKYKNKNMSERIWTDMTTEEIKKESELWGRRNFELPTIKPVYYEQVLLPIPSYTLGAWLGDGARKVGTITTMDQGIVDRVVRDGFAVQNICPKKNSRASAYRFFGLRKKLKQLGVLDKYSYEKSIPEDYKEASPWQRLEILRGLMDTDGECNKNGTPIFSSSSKLLVEDVKWLVRSLGGKVNEQRVKNPFYMKEGERVYCRPCYRISFSMPECPFYLERKASRWKRSEDRYLARWIDSIEFSHYEEAQCVQVDSDDKLFLMNDFIPTHNSALVSWLILWAISTFKETKGVVTANTETQLRTKTWSELSKWYNLFVAKPLFTLTATSIYSSDETYQKTWRIDAVPWSETNHEAFAGLHNQGKRLLVVFDEGSGIADVIWEVTEGTLTDRNTEIIWCCYGNPTRSSGRFFDCFHGLKHRWETRRVDSRNSLFSNKEEIAKWIEDYGEDSDFVRVRVKGEFPRASTNQFIPSDIVYEASKRRPDMRANSGYNPIVGVDVARYGDDLSVMTIRQGNMTHPPRSFSGLGTMEVASKCIDIYRELGNRGVFCVDGIGVGAGVVDRLKQLGIPVIDVQSAAKPLDTRTYYNKRAELLGRAKEYLVAGGSIPPVEDMIKELTAPEYTFNNKLQIVIESKDDIKKKIGTSPNYADSFAYTFAYDEAVQLSNSVKAKPIKKVMWF